MNAGEDAEREAEDHSWDELDPKMQVLLDRLAERYEDSMPAEFHDKVTQWFKSQDKVCGYTREEIQLMRERTLAKLREEFAGATPKE